MHEVTRRVKAALMSKYQDQGFAVPVAIRERPIRAQYTPWTKRQAEMVTPMAMPMQPDGPPDLGMLGGMLGQAMDMGGMPVPGMPMSGMDPMAAAMGGQPAPGMGMAGPPPLPPGPGPQGVPQGAPAASQAPQAMAQPGPGVNPQQILAALFGA